MTEFVCCFERGGEPVAQKTVSAMMDPIRHCGVDGDNIVCRGPVGMGQLLFRTTPEEQGERLPLKHGASPTWLLWNGRLDNREELYKRLVERSRPLARMSDAALFLQYFIERGEAGLERVIGPFAVVVYDERERRLTLACDAFSGRTLYYHVAERLFVAATQEPALYAYPRIELTPNHARMVRYFTLAYPTDDQTLVNEVRLLLPGEAMTVTVDKLTRREYWLPDPEARLDHKSDEEFAEHFRHLLDLAVQCRLRTQHPPAIMLSGGLDSAPASVIAARHLARSGSPHRLLGVSWTFDRHVECDERAYMQPLYRDHGVVPVQVNCDDAWPLFDERTWPTYPAFPRADLYREMNTRAYRAAHAAGARVLLTGMFGDMLYGNTWNTVYELLRQHRLKDALREYRLRSPGLASTDRVKRFLLWHMAAYRWARRRCRPRPPVWLTPYAAARFSREPPWPRRHLRARRPGQYLAMLNSTVGAIQAYESYVGAQHGIQLRNPYRDRRLIEFALKIPSRQLQFGGVTRPILRRAMGADLPGSIGRRVDKTSLFSVAGDGLYRARKEAVEKYYYAPDRSWPRYVREQGVDYQALSVDEDIGIYWRCVVFEIWRKKSPIGHLFD